MRLRTLVALTTAPLAALLLGCESSRVLESAPAGDDQVGPSTAEGKPSQFATLITLPSLSGRTAEALAVNTSGTVIAGYAWERRGTMRAVKWMLQPNGSWTIEVLPEPIGATGAIARGVNRAGDVAGNHWPGTAPHPVLWPTSGGFNVLGCNDLGEVFGISADAQVLVGRGSSAAQPGPAAVWRAGACREDLPPLLAGEGASAYAVNADGTIIGGAATPSPGSISSVPVRWRRVAGVWQIEQLDQRPGIVLGANAAGDLAGSVVNPCPDEGGCQRAAIWYASGGFQELGTLGGADSWARGINAAREVVGGSTRPDGVNTGFFWSESAGLLELPSKGRWATPNGISDVRSDGTRLVAGMGSSAEPVAWVVQNP